jgi:tetratricopeptide (TPR) repeat protein
MISALPLALLAFVPTDIAPNPRNRSALDLAPAEGEQATEIAMRAEVVELVLHEDYAEVRAVFDMQHTGSVTESLEVGFPTEATPIPRSVREGLDYSGGFDGGGTIYAFQAEVDGESIEAERKQVDEDDEREVHRHWVCWPMEFAPGQRRRIEVRYEVETKDSMYLEPQTALQPRELIYVLKTGRGWKDTIGSARILLRAAEGFDLGRVDWTTPKPTLVREGEWEWRFEDFEPDQDIRVRYRVYKDAKEAVVRITAALVEQPDNAVLLLDLADNRAALGQYAEAAELYARLADWGRDEPPRRGGRQPKAVFHRLYYPTAEFLAARNYAAAGQLELAREPWARRAVPILDKRIESLRRFVDRARADDRDPGKYGKLLEEALARREELARLL